MTQQLTEDDLYRTSTQFRLWSFAPEALASLRAATHSAAIERAKTYLNHNGVNGTANGGQNGSSENHNDLEAQCLTLEDEVRLVQRYSDQVRSTSDHFKWPVNVKATAVQYLKRFYLTNSCLTYPPKEIYKSVLFLASKTEGTHMTLGEYARRISTAPDVILAPEYKIIQALRFTLDVRQPFRGLKGALMELLNMAAGNLVPLPSTSPDARRSGADVAAEMAQLPPPSSADLTSWKQGQPPSDRAHAAYASARTLLDAPALLTDVYFLYTPPQIYLAALRLSDAVLTDFYLSTKLPLGQDTTARILATVGSCAEMLAGYDAKKVMSKEGRAELEKKLEVCRDPGTRDMVAVNAKVKGGDGDEAQGAEKAKRRKLEREMSAREGEDLFGPAIGGK